MIYTLKDNSRIKINLINNFMKDQSNYVPRMVISDQARFVQCASTLIQNSINNMVEGQISILVRFDPYKQQVYFEVEDSAKGIRQRDLDHLNTMLNALHCPNISMNNQSDDVRLS